MSLAQITEKIRKDAEREAEEIIAKANAQAEEMRRRASEENDALKSSFERRYEAERPEIFRRREVVAGLDVKKMMLQARRDIINDVYAAALVKLKGLGREEYLDFCAMLLNGAVSSGEETIRVGTGEKYIDEAWVASYNQKNGRSLVLSDDRVSGISGGFILEDGRIGVNCSWEMLLQIAQEKYEADIIKRLFQPVG